MIVLLLLLALTTGGQSWVIPPAERIRVDALVTLANPETRTPIEALSRAIRAGLIDESAHVRETAVGLIHMRLIQSLWAGTRGPGVGPSPRGMPPPPPQPMIPLEWRGDRELLRKEFTDLCLSMARSDPSDTVRHAALLAALMLDMEFALPQRISAQMQAVALRFLREDRIPPIRAEMVKTIRLAGRATVEAIQALANALVDPAPEVRHDARMASSHSTAGPVVKVTFADARPVLVAALSDPNPEIRTGALEAFGEFQRESAAELAAIDKVASSDADPNVRALAARVAASIRK